MIQAPKISEFSRVRLALMRSLCTVTSSEMQRAGLFRARLWSLVSAFEALAPAESGLVTVDIGAAVPSTFELQDN